MAAGRRTGQAYAVVLLRLQYVKKSVGKARLVFCLEVGMLAYYENKSTRELTYLKSSSA